jgi:hypothetical protein
MQSDSAYLAQYPTMMSLLIGASGGDFACIPSNYLENFHHSYLDGDISFLPAFSKLENTDFAEDWQIEEAVEFLSKVNPQDWPNMKDIEGINFQELLQEESEDWEFVEDNLGTSEKVEKVLKAVLESVFGKGVSSIRDRSGSFPSPHNNFLQDEDGTFSGTFKHETHEFTFEIAPTERGWLCTYRLSEKSLDGLEEPAFKGKEDRKKELNPKTVRMRSW